MFFRKARVIFLLYRKDNTVMVAVSPSQDILRGETNFFASSFYEPYHIMKGAILMEITFSDIFQFCLVIIGIISLCQQAKKK